MNLNYRGERGSALILVFFVCVAVAVVLQAAAGALWCAQRAVADEAVGRERLTEKERILSAVRQRSLTSWAPFEWTEMESGEGALTQIRDDDSWLLEAGARQSPSLSLGTTYAWMERGRDGLDLPTAALVADTVTADSGRSTPWVGVDDGNGGQGTGADPVVIVADCFLRREPAGLCLGPGLGVETSDATWHLDAGWASFARSAADAAEGGALLAGVGPGGQAVFLQARSGLSRPVPAGTGVSAECPALVVLTGGGTLDARGLGDFYGVIVGEGEEVLLEGTTVHGAVFTPEVVRLGATGLILFSRETLRWATDRSLARARLVPGTRWEDME